jgi:hypothetical protein
MSYVLVFWILGTSNIATATAPFGSQMACQQALIAIQGKFQTGRADGMCVAAGK